MSRYYAVIVSIIVHFSVLSLVLFSTDRADALIVDHMITSSRFAFVEELDHSEHRDQPTTHAEAVIVEMPDEIDDISKHSVHRIPSWNPNTQQNWSHSKPLSKDRAARMAQTHGLLAQSSAMNSMLVAAQAMHNSDFSWAAFDGNAEIAMNHTGTLAQTGVHHGGTGTKGFGSGLNSSGSRGQDNGWFAAGMGNVATLKVKKETEVKVSTPSPRVVSGWCGGSSKQFGLGLRGGCMAVTGALDKRVIQKVVRQHLGELRACYERELSVDKKLEGEVEIHWIISPQGSVQKAVVADSTLNNRTVENCTTKAIQHWRFPASLDGGLVLVEYPFSFEVGIR